MCNDYAMLDSEHCLILLHACSVNYLPGMQSVMCILACRHTDHSCLPVCDVRLGVPVCVVDHGVERLVDPLAKYHLGRGSVGGGHQ